MSRPKKTLKVAKILDKANHFFEHSTCHPDLRKAVASFVADLLHEANCYQGFGYLETETDIYAGHYGEDGRVFFYTDHRIKED